MLAKLKELIGKIASPDPEVEKLYGGAKSEREALILLKEARKRDEKRRKGELDDIEKLFQEEAGYFEEARKDDVSEARKLWLARQVKDVRVRLKIRQDKLKIYDNRMLVLSEHVRSLETIIEVREEPVPNMDVIETTAIRAKTLLGELDEMNEIAHAITVPHQEEALDDQTQGILDEMSERARKDKEKKEAAKEKAEKKTEKKPMVTISKKPEKRNVIREEEIDFDVER
jgi:hypothetical protein